MRYRKNIDCLTTDELHDLREALAGLYALPAGNPRSFAVQASFHGGPPTAYCRHGAPGFFTWHRAEMLAFEDALRSIRCNCTLPYWDWSSGPSTGVPEACRFPTYVNRSGSVVPNPLYSGPRPGGGQTSRRANIDTTTFDDIAASAQTAMSATTFSSFQNQMNGVHGSVHGRVGGDMGSVPSAAYDPIFYLHHANVDRLWAAWQAAHPGPLPASEATFALPPFNKPFTTQWQVGADVESTDALDYRYRRFCFYFPPIRVWEAVRINWPLPLREQMTSARLVLKSTKMQQEPVEIRAFVEQTFAGVAGFIGHGAKRAAQKRAPRAAEVVAMEAVGALAEQAFAGAGVAVDVRLDEVMTDGGHHPLRHGGHDHTHDHGDSKHQPTVQEIAGEERFDVEIDVTAAVRRVAREAKDVSLKLVAVGSNGEQLPASALALDEIEVIVD